MPWQISLPVLNTQCPTQRELQGYPSKKGTTADRVQYIPTHSSWNLDAVEGTERAAGTPLCHTNLLFRQTSHQTFRRFLLTSVVIMGSSLSMTSAKVGRSSGSPDMHAFARSCTHRSSLHKRPPVFAQDWDMTLSAAFGE